MAERSFIDRRGTTVRFTQFGLLLRAGGEDGSSTVYSYRHIVSAEAVLQSQGPEVSVQVGSTATAIRPETMEEAHKIVEALAEHGH
jgi:hypothetical protein